MELVALERQAGAAEGRRREGCTNAAATAVREVCGIAQAVAWERGLGVQLVDPQAAMRALCGRGARSASKAQIRCAAQALLRAPRALSEHEADAAAVAVAAEFPWPRRA